MRRQVLGACVMVSAAAGGMLFGQTGRLEGNIRDSALGVLPGTTVEALRLADMVAITTVTDATGSYRFTVARPGAYRLTVVLQGFVSQKREPVVVVVNRTTQENFSMSLAEGPPVTIGGGRLPEYGTIRVVASPPLLPFGRTLRDVLGEAVAP